MQKHSPTWKYSGFSIEYSIFSYAEVYLLSKFACSYFIWTVKVCTISLSLTNHPAVVLSKEASIAPQTSETQLDLGKQNYSILSSLIK